jgi:hypothetical protein
VVAVEKGRALIDVGSTAGIEKGMKFTVMRSAGTVASPDGEALIPKPERPVGQVEAIEVGAHSAWVRAGAKEARVGDRVAMKPKRASVFWAINDALKPPPCLE